MKVSVLVPIYGVEKYIEKCVVSLMEQKYNDIEFVFVDDCSKDKSMEILRNTIEYYPTRYSQIKIIKHQKNCGLSATRNTAFENSTGDYVIHLDSDDYFDEDMISQMVNKVEKENADMVVCDIKVEYGNGKSDIWQNIVYDDINDYITAFFLRKTATPIVARLTRRSVYEKYKVKSIEGLDYGEDYVTSPRLCSFCQKVVRVPIPFYHYIRFNNGSYTRTMTKKSVDDLVKANEVLEQFFKNKNIVSNETIIKGKMISKVSLLYGSPYYLYEYIQKIYPEIDYRKVDLSILHKIILSMMNIGFFKLTYFLCSIINRIRKCA